MKSSEGFDRMMESIRAQAQHRIGSLIHADAQADFDVVRKAMIVAEALTYMGIEIPEARSLVAEVQDLVMQLRGAKEVMPALRHYL